MCIRDRLGRVGGVVVGDEVAGDHSARLGYVGFLVVGVDCHADPVAGEAVAQHPDGSAGVGAFVTDGVVVGDVVLDEDVAGLALPNVEA